MCFKCLFRFLRQLWIHCDFLLYPVFQILSLLVFRILCGPEDFFACLFGTGNLDGWRKYIANCFCDRFFLIAPNYDVACWGKESTVCLVVTVIVKHHCFMHYRMVVCLSLDDCFLVVLNADTKHDPRMKVLSMPMIPPPSPMQFMIYKLSFRSNLSVIGN